MNLSGWPNLANMPLKKLIFLSHKFVNEKNILEGHSYRIYSDNDFQLFWEVSQSVWEGDTFREATYVEISPLPFPYINLMFYGALQTNEQNGL